MASTQSTSRRLDFVIDNAGSELIVDMLLADWLLSQGHYAQVIFHAKSYPWFVSDNTPHDILQTIQLAAQCQGEVGVQGLRWRAHLQNDRFRIATHPYWTTLGSFPDMHRLAPTLHTFLAGSAMLILKGDLNYRKLVRDVAWPSPGPNAPEVPVMEVMQPFPPVPCAVLRTLKSQTMIGVPESVTRRLESNWSSSGKYGIIQQCKM